MNDNLFTATVPSGFGWWWVRWRDAPVKAVQVGMIGTGFDCTYFWIDGVLRNTDDYLFGPRIPTPEQCRELNQKPA